ncbi:hypothetical protein ACIBFB_12375 [Nocardiopsis sp. NPDC050513]|uniref:HD domain-containing protein n=1 Tax=Nocardiopsis sp. NPDC050513 TaxID=3364338 RepID=UPI0037BA4843
MIQARDIHGGVVIHRRDDAPPAPRDPWVERVAESPVWNHVLTGHDVEPFRTAAADVAARLVPLRDGTERRLAADPWLDPGAPLRFLERVEALLHEAEAGRDLDLYPAEAALLALTPLLFRVHDLRTAAGLADEVAPGTLERLDRASERRRAFEDFAEEHGVLVKRARRRPDDGAAIGWWLFHRWVLRPENTAGRDRVRALVEAVQPSACALGGTLAADRLTRFLHGLRRGPGVCNPEFLGLLKADESVRADRPQRVREQRVMLVLALGFGMTLEASSLPEVVAEHLAVPDPVVPERLLRDVADAHWGGPEGLPVLEAMCHHAALIEALRAHVARADELLYEIHQADRERLNQPLPKLPVRLSAGGVQPAEGVFEGWARFRIDERRARELLTGVQLYKDRDLAIRELYQNALDACRYRRARTEYLDRTSAATYAYEGRIAFTQGVDEHGRRYVDCRDNGVGMGETELRGVFSHAGARFAEQSDFLVERERWESLEPPVKLYPNSRFGIGVLSYFMLADEIHVTTCRMGADGSLGPVLEASIQGPGNLYRINRVAERGTGPGTCVRLYLGGDAAVTSDWSCVRALGGVLCVAEFHTSGNDGTREREWPPGVLQAQEVKAAGSPRRSGLHFGAHVTWEDAPEGADVFWVERDGALLVDGLLVSVSWAAGHQSLTARESGLTGAVVNLSGAYAPSSLSADRTQVLSDVSPVLRSLLEGAVEALGGAGAEFWNSRWIGKVSRASPLIGDLVIGYAVREDISVDLGGVNVRPRISGLLPADALLTAQVRDDLDYVTMRFLGDWRRGQDTGHEDHILLWRVLAVGRAALVDELIGIRPELASVSPLRRASPSDQLLVFLDAGADLRGHEITPGSEIVPELASRLDTTAAGVMRRFGDLGLLGTRPDLAMDVMEAMGFEPLVCAMVLDGTLDVGDGVGTMALTYLAHAMGADVQRIADVVRGCGVEVGEDTVRAARSPVVQEVRRVCLRHKDSFARGGPWPQLYRGLTTVAENLGMSPFELCEQLAGCGFDVGGLVRDLALGRIAGFTMTREKEEEFRERSLVRLIPSREMTYLSACFESRTSVDSLREVLARLERLGVDVPIRIPDPLSRLGERLLRDESYVMWPNVPLGSAIPFADLLHMERQTGADRKSVVGALADFGLRPSCQELPPGLDPHDAAVLVFGRGHYAPPISTGSPLSLHNLIVGAQHVGAPLTQVAEWFRALGYVVPDVAETIGKAIPLIPRRGQAV